MNKKNTARTRETTLLASVSNPQAIRVAPMNDEPRYPAGSVSQATPPDMLVTPPSSAVHYLIHVHGWIKMVIFKERK